MVDLYYESSSLRSDGERLFHKGGRDARGGSRSGSGSGGKLDLNRLKQSVGALAGFVSDAR